MTDAPAGEDESRPEFIIGNVLNGESLAFKSAVYRTSVQSLPTGDCAMIVTCSAAAV